MSTNLHNFTRGAALNDYVAKRLQPLADTDLMRRAPSVFAERAHESRSARYAYIPTIGIVNSLRDQGFMPVEATQSLCRLADRSAFTKHQIKFTHADATAATRVGDAIAQIVLKNAHDGSSAYELSLGLFRFVCSNGLMVCDGSFNSIRVPHVGDVRERVIEGAFDVIGATREVTEKADSWRAVQLTHPEQEAFAKSALALRFDGGADEKTFPLQPAEILRARRQDDGGGDLWSTFNRVQENLVKGGQQYLTPAHRTETGRVISTRRMRTREVKGIDQNSSLNRALWRLAEEMRTLKQAA